MIEFWLAMITVVLFIALCGIMSAASSIQFCLRQIAVAIKEHSEVIKKKSF